MRYVCRGLRELDSALLGQVVEVEVCGTCRKNELRVVGEIELYPKYKSVKNDKC
jgi:hypothetical protein